MNRALPPRDRGHRGGNPGGQSRPAGAVSGSVRLVGGVAHPPRRATPPESGPGGGWDRSWWRSALNRVGALPVLALGGFDGESHFLAQCAADEPPDTVRLPVR